MNAILRPSREAALTATMFLVSMSLVLFELLLTRLFGVVLFASFAHLALMLALLGIGVGAVVQHVYPQALPEEGLEENLAKVCLAMTVAMLLAVFCAVTFPLTAQGDDSVVNFAHRGSKSLELINPGWFTALLVMLVLPFIFAGLAFAGAFQRRKDIIGRLYGADLIGGGVAGVIFIPVLAILAGPDVIFVSGALPLVAAYLLYASLEQKKHAQLAAGAVGVFLLLMVVGSTGIEVLKVRYSAGYNEDDISYVEWTPLTRLAVHDDGHQTKVLLDNSSASEVMLTEKNLQRKIRDVDRSTVYALHQDHPGRVAVLAASAGPEVAIAQSFGFDDIYAIDIAGEIAALVARQFPDSPVNPYLKSGVVRVKADARAAVMHSDKPFDIIQMVHANLHSNAGMLANVWSPSLLETVEAFNTYFDNISPDGTLSFARGGHTPLLARAATIALRERGVTQPWKHIMYIRGRSTRFMLVKPRPWKVEERDKIVAFLESYGNRNPLQWDATNAEPNNWVQRNLLQGPVLTDDRPYLDHPGLMTNVFKRFMGEKIGSDGYLGRVYTVLALQLLFCVLGGLLFLFLPLLLKGRTEVQNVSRKSHALAYVACLGYGYLAIETVLIHELVLFVGHPTYAVTAVILSMLVFSGLGSVFAGRIPEEKLSKALAGVLAIVVVLSLIQGFFVPDFLKANFLGLSVPARLFLVGALIAPLGFFMGMPFSAGMRILPDHASGLVPWAWALNGWMSVVASLATVLISRNYGYSYAYIFAIGAYGLAFLLSGYLQTVGRQVADAGEATDKASTGDDAEGDAAKDDDAKNAA